MVWNEVAPYYHKRWAKNEIGPFNVTNELFESVPVSVDANELTTRSNDYSIYMIVGIIVSAILVVIWRKKSS